VKFLPLRDNALFLVNWRERTRPTAIAGIVVVSVAVMMSVILACWAIAHPAQTARRLVSPPSVWLAWAVAALAAVHAIVLLLIGTSAVAAGAARERSTGTLDSHRISATRRADQVLGLAFGGAISEWGIVAATAPVSLVLVLVSRISLLTFIGAYISLALTAVLCQSIAVTLGLAMGPGIKVRKETGIGALPALFLGGLSIAGAMTMSGPFFHATCAPACARLFLEAFVPPNSGELSDALGGLLGQLWHLRPPGLVLQAIVQGPVIVLAWVASIRLVSRPDGLILSKVQSVAAVAFVLLLVVASALPVLANEVMAGGPVRDGVGWGSMGVLLYVGTVLGLLGVALATPAFPLYTRGLRRKEKLGIARIGWTTDQASNGMWLVVFALLFSGAYAVLVQAIPSRMGLLPTIAAPVVVVGNLVWFGALLEAFRLSSVRRSKSLFTVVVAMPWVLVPVMGFIVGGLYSDANVAIHFFVASPLFGPAALSAAVVGKLPGGSTGVIITALAVNIVLAVAALLLAARERSRCALLAKAPND
jgi:hypothetical protein